MKAEMFIREKKRQERLKLEIREGEGGGEERDRWEHS